MAAAFASSAASRSAAAARMAKRRITTACRFRRGARTRLDTIPSPCREAKPGGQLVVKVLDEVDARLHVGAEFVQASQQAISVHPRPPGGSAADVRARG